MVGRNVQKTRAVVLRTLDYGESDRIVTFISADFGKLKGIAKGARRSKRRFANALELLSLSEILFSRGGRGGLFLIEGADVISHHPGIREDLEKTLIATYLAELVEGFSAEGKKNVELFRLLGDFLAYLDREAPRAGIERFFEMRLLRLTGYDLHIGSCLACGKELEEISEPAFIPAEGGIRCRICLRNATAALSVAPGTLKTLITGSRMDLQMIPRLVVSDRTARESRAVLGGIIEHLLGKALKSLKVLDDMRKTVL
jgi:DNA repair protein RecO (recombination protein O)